jgi:hypothetical protein
MTTLKEHCNAAFEKMRKRYPSMTTTDIQSVAQFIVILTETETETETTGIEDGQMKCGDCGKILDDFEGNTDSLMKLVPPIEISNWDKESLI